MASQTSERVPESQISTQDTTSNGPSTPGRSSRLEGSPVPKHHHKALYSLSRQAPRERGSPINETNKNSKQLPAFIADSQATEETIHVQDTDEGMERNEEDVKTGGKRAGVWDHYNNERIDQTYIKGKSTSKREVPDKRNIGKTRGRSFSRMASKLHGSTTTLSAHLGSRHEIRNPLNPAAPPSGDSYMAPVTRVPEFNEALLDWIVDTNQPFTATEQERFRAMMEAAGTICVIPKADDITRQIHQRIDLIRSDLKELLARTCNTIALSLDSWTSNNDICIFAINGRWLGPNFKPYRACLDFIEINGTHTGLNLSEIVYNIGKLNGILPKIFTVTRGNTGNDDTLCHHLEQRLLSLYDHADSEFPDHDHGKTMRFYGNQSQIRCFSHVLNLICKAVLESLGSSSHEKATNLLNRAATHGWSTITVPAAVGDIQILRIVVLWIYRSPQRIREWDKRDGVTGRIPYDVETGRTYTLKMVTMALKHRVPLMATIKEHPELAHLKFGPARWNRLAQIVVLLTLFEEFALHVSKAEPTVQFLPALYGKLEQTLRAVISKEGSYTAFDASLVKAALAGLSEFQLYCDDVQRNDIYLIACILDPRVKTLWIEKNITNARSIINRIKDTLKQAYPAEVVLPERPIQDAGQRRNLELDFLEEYAANGYSDEIDMYFDSPRVAYQLNVKESLATWILNYWATHKDDYPRMAAIARDYIAIPGAEVDVERLFGVGKDTLGIKRWSMPEESFKALIIAKDALRRERDGQV